MAPKAYSDDVRDVLVKLKHFFERKKSERAAIMLENINEHICRNIITRLLKPKKASEPKCATNKVDIDDFDQQAIIRKIHQFYQRREFPTLDKLLKVVREDLNFTGGRTTLWKCLKTLGFKFKKQNGRKFLIEKPEIVFLRHRYLRKMRKIRRNKPQSKIIYLDETWINANHTPSKCWVDRDGKGDISASLRKGQRLIIVHAGSCDGFVPQADLNFVSKNSGDYHDEMNGKHFEEWLENKVFPNIPENSTVIMDNASYHSVKAEKTPNMKSKKADMQSWLTQKNVKFPSNAKKERS